MSDTISARAERRYTCKDYASDCRLAEDKLDPVPCPPGLFFSHELGHVPLDDGAVMFVLCEELNEYSSTLESLYAIAEADYLRLKGAGVLSNAERARALGRRKPLIEVGLATQQPDVGLFSGKNTKTYFSESEARAELERQKREASQP